MIGRIVCVVGLVTGCDNLFGLRSFEHPIPDAAPDAPVDAFVPEVGCSPMRMLADDFSTTPALWNHRVTTNANTLVQTGGQIQLGMVSAGLVVFGDDRFYDLRNDNLSAQIAIVGNLDPGSFVELSVTSEQPQNYLTFSLENGKLVMRRHEGAQQFEVNRVTYTGAEVYWRIANAGIHTTWETSTNGVDYTIRGITDNLPYIGFMRPMITASSSGASTWSVAIDNVDQGLAPSHACRAVQLHDDFEGPTLGQQWARTYAINGTLDQQGGTLNATYNTDGTVTAIALIPSALYDLRNGVATVEIPQMVDVMAAQLQVLLAITSVDGSQAVLQQGGGTVYATKTGGTLVNAVPYDPVAHRWWRLREAAGTVYWEVSSDGSTFAQLGMASDLTGFERTDIAVAASGTAVKPASASFDNFDP